MVSIRPSDILEDQKQSQERRTGTVSKNRGAIIGCQDCIAISRATSTPFLYTTCRADLAASTATEPKHFALDDFFDQLCDRQRRRQARRLDAKQIDEARSGVADVKVSGRLAGTDQLWSDAGICVRQFERKRVLDMSRALTVYSKAIALHARQEIAHGFKDLVETLFRWVELLRPKVFLPLFDWMA